MKNRFWCIVTISLSLFYGCGSKDNDDRETVTPEPINGSLDSIAIENSGCREIIKIDPKVNPPKNKITKGCYFLSSNLKIEERLEIEAGVKIFVADSSLISVAESGSIIAKGNATNNILFRGVKQNTSTWRGILIYDQSVGNVFNHVHISGGGRSTEKSAAALRVKAHAELLLEDSQISFSDTRGLVLDKESRLLEFKNNKFVKNSEAAIATDANLIGMLSKYVQEFSANGKDFIEVIGGHVNESQTWKAMGLKYRVLDDIIVGKNNSHLVDLQIEGGTFLEFSNQKIFEVHNARLVTKRKLDTDNKKHPIVLTAVEKTPGSWVGLKILSQSTQHQIEDLQIEYAGYTKLPLEQPTAILLGEKTHAIIKNSIIANIKGNGLILGANAMIDNFTQNQISKTSLSPIKLYPHQIKMMNISNQITESGQNFIHVIGGQSVAHQKIVEAMTIPYINFPYRLFDQLIIDMKVSSDVLKIEPGVVLEFSNLRGGLGVFKGGIQAIGNRDKRIVFQGTLEQKGAWAGIVINTENLTNILEFVDVKNAGSKKMEDLYSIYPIVETAIFVGANGKVNLQNVNIENSASSCIIPHQSQNARLLNSNGNELYFSDANQLLNELKVNHSFSCLGNEKYPIIFR